MDENRLFKKAFFTFADGLDDLLAQNGEDFDRFAQAYSLPRRRSKEYWSRLADAGEHVQLLLGDNDFKNLLDIVEAVVHELTTIHPSICRKFRPLLSVQSAPSDIVQHPLTQFLLEMESLGYSLIGNRLIPSDSESVREHKQLDALSQAIQGCAAVDAKVLISHIASSNQCAKNGDWHPATNEARCVFEGVLVGIAKSESKRTGIAIPGLPASGQNKADFRPCRDYLKASSFLTTDEDEWIRTSYGIISRTGSHPGLTDQDWGRLVRRMSFLIASYLLGVYHFWTTHNHRRTP